MEFGVLTCQLVKVLFNLTTRIDLRPLYTRFQCSAVQWMLRVLAASFDKRSFDMLCSLAYVRDKAAVLNVYIFRIIETVAAEFYRQPLIESRSTTLKSSELSLKSENLKRPQSSSVNII